MRKYRKNFERCFETNNMNKTFLCKHRPDLGCQSFNNYRKIIQTYGYSVMKSKSKKIQKI